VGLKYALDTNVVSAPSWVEPPARLMELLEDHAGSIGLPTPVWHELMFGVSIMPSGRRRRALERYLKEVVVPSYPQLAYDRLAAEWHGRERARLSKAGRTPPYLDGQIAAIAATNDLVLVTNNAKDFTGFTGLEIEDWSQER